MKIVRSAATMALSLFLCLIIRACAGGKTPVNIGINNGKLADCPASPNCVSSDAADADHYVEPIPLTGSAEEDWLRAQKLVAELPRTKIITVDNNYLHAECRSAVFGFVDDLELHLRPQERIIAVRSAARLGYSDFGVNRKRVEELRTRFLQQRQDD